MLNPPNQSENTGSLVVMRKDGKPLLPMHVQALFMYTSTKLMDPDHPKHACLTPDMLQIDRIDKVSKEDFVKWYHHGGHPSVVPSPFDMENDFENEKASINVKHV
jgi:hypothetical protein